MFDKNSLKLKARDGSKNWLKHGKIKGNIAKKIDEYKKSTKVRIPKIKL